MFVSLWEKQRLLCPAPPRPRGSLAQEVRAKSGVPGPRATWKASRFVIAFFPRNKYLLISWLQSPSAVILEPKKIKSVTVPIFFPIHLP